MHIKWYRRYAAERLCPRVENAYLNGTIDLPPSVNEGALPIKANFKWADVQLKDKKDEIFHQIVSVDRADFDDFPFGSTVLHSIKDI